MAFSFLPPSRCQSRYTPRPLQHTATSKKLVKCHLQLPGCYVIPGIVFSFQFTQYPVKCLIIGAEGTPKWHVRHRRRNQRTRRLQNVEERRKIAPGSRCSQNRKQKYGGNSANKFADPDFLFDFVYIRGSIWTACDRLQVSVLYYAHYKALADMRKMTITIAIRIPGKWSQNALFVTGVQFQGV